MLQGRRIGAPMRPKLPSSLLTLAACALAAPASAQVLAEDFTYSATALFPPAGWTTSDLGTAPIVWREASLGTGVQVLTADAAVHRWTTVGVPTLSRLTSPTFDLSGLGTPVCTFDSALNDVEWMLHFSGPSGSLGNGTSDLDLSTDGGVTWTSEWQETAQVDGYTPGLQVDLAPYAGQPAVQLCFRYAGDDGHEWAVDAVVVDNGGNPVGPSLAVVGGCPGPVTVQGSGMTPGGAVGLGYGTQSAPTVLAGGPCAGTTVQVASALRVLVLQADAAGAFALGFTLPPAACGALYGQALDVATCAPTNVVTP